MIVKFSLVTLSFAGTQLAYVQKRVTKNFFFNIFVERTAVTQVHIASTYFC